MTDILDPKYPKWGEYLEPPAPAAAPAQEPPAYVESNDCPMCKERLREIMNKRVLSMPDDPAADAPVGSPKPAPAAAPDALETYWIGGIEYVHASALRAAQERIGELSDERKDWARRFMLDGATPWDWQNRAIKAESALAAERETAGRMLDALGALGVIGDGYCFCSRNRDPNRYHHEPECRDARAALKEGEGKC